MTIERTRYVFDDSLWPLHITVTPNVASLEEIQRFMTMMEAVYARKQKFLAVAFVPGVLRQDRQTIKRYGEWMRDTRESVRLYSMGTVFITPSMLFRFVLSGLFLIQPLESPHEIVADIDAAVPWIASTLRSHGMPVPSRLAERLRPFAPEIRSAGPALDPTKTSSP